MRLIFLLASVFISFSCSQNINNYKTSEKVKLTSELKKKVAFEIKRKTGLIPVGTGGGMMDQIRMLALSFFYYEEIDIEQGRELLIVSLTEFLDAVNSDERIRLYLKNYPFEPKNIEIRIFIKEKDNRGMGPGKISVISALGGILDYDIRDPETSRLKTIYTESYEEALIKVHEALKKSG